MSDLTTIPSSAADAVPADIPSARRADRRMWLLQEGWTGFVLIALVIGFTIWSSSFLSRLNWLNTSSTATEVLLLALGETFVIIAGGIDLSVGAVLGLSGMTGGWVMSELSTGTNPNTAAVVAAGFATAIVIGSFCGLVNGWLIARHNIPAFVVTLGSMGVATGLADLVYNGQEISNIPAWVGSFGNKDLLGWIPVPVLITAALCVVCGLALAKTRFGSHTYTIGDNRDAAIRAGIPYQRHLIKIYTLAGLLAGIDGVLVMSRLDAASPTSGTTDNLNAIAAVVIGGASLFGGQGSFVGTVAGALTLTLLGDVIFAVHLPSYWTVLADGLLLIAAVLAGMGLQALQARRAGGGA